MMTAGRERKNSYLSVCLATRRAEEEEEDAAPRHVNRLAGVMASAASASAHSGIPFFESSPEIISGERKGRE